MIVIVVDEGLEMCIHMICDAIDKVGIDSI